MAISIEERPAVELTFWRTLYRYLLSIVASLVCGAAWYFTGVKFLHLGVLGTIVTGVIALALGFLLIGYLWLAIDVGRPLPEGVDEHDRNMQLFVLWMGIPLAVLGLCALVMMLAVVVAATVLHGNIPTPR
ncbi:MAG: hypothetical protein ACR2MY_15535 [Candidatus Dormibacteria bacterium]